MTLRLGPGLNYRGVFFTPHALGRMREMEVTTHEAWEAVTNPELSWDDKPGGRGEPRKVRVKGRVAVVIEKDRKVVTCLWHGKEGRE